MKTSKSRISVFAKAAMCIAVIFCIVQIVSFKIEYSNQKNQQEAIQEKIDRYSSEVDELENKLETPFDDEYIISVANEKLDYCFPEEVFFIVN